ncbi:MAG TPA: cation diffusion facilitator family transporter [Candidatus Omnitrophota bacterium]|nr:cation diffusion facilitator family transporter [Candidatus Omnitrophota bacterium]
MNAGKGLLLAREERARQVAKVLWITLGLNWGVAALKVLFGLATNCVSITADGVHSFSDGTSNVIGLIAMTIAGHPADRDHPYGHQKYETLASAGIAFFLFAAALGIARGAFVSWNGAVAPQVSAASFVVMIATLAVNIFVVWYERKMGRRYRSELLLSDSWHTITDIFVTLGVVVALLGIWLGVPKADAIFSFGIAALIAWTAWRILKHSSDILCDRAAVDIRSIETVVRSVQGVFDCHEIRSRGSHECVYLDLHVLVDPEMTVAASHRVANLIEREIKNKIPGIFDVVVHIEPVSHDHAELEEGS